MHFITSSTRNRRENNDKIAEEKEDQKLFVIVVCLLPHGFENKKENNRGIFISLYYAPFFTLPFLIITCVYSETTNQMLYVYAKNNTYKLPSNYW